MIFAKNLRIIIAELGRENKNKTSKEARKSKQAVASRGFIHKMIVFLENMVLVFGEKEYF